MKTTFPTLLLAATLCASALVTPVAQAQMTYYAPIGIWPGVLGLSQKVSQNIYGRGRETENTVRKSSGGVRHTPKKTLTTTTYRASRAVSHRVQTRLIAFVAKENSPETVAQLKRDFKGDVVGKWARQVASDGLRGGDVADAMAANWVQNWQVANGVMETQPAQVRGVRRQLAAILASNAGFAKLSNARRQEMAEGYIYSQALQSNAYLDAVNRGDEALKEQMSDGTAAGFKKAMGLDLRRVKLTNTGFAAKG